MAHIEVTSMSSRGQVVIPLGIRQKLKLEEGEKFIVEGDSEIILLKKIKPLSKEEFLKRFHELAKKNEEHVKKLGIKESDVPKIIHRFRGIKDE